MRWDHNRQTLYWSWEQAWYLWVSRPDHCKWWVYNLGHCVSFRWEVFNLLDSHLDWGLSWSESKSFAQTANVTNVKKFRVWDSQAGEEEHVSPKWFQHLPILYATFVVGKQPPVALRLQGDAQMQPLRQWEQSFLSTEKSWRAFPPKKRSTYDLGFECTMSQSLAWTWMKWPCSTITLEDIMHVLKTFLYPDDAFQLSANRLWYTTTIPSNLCYFSTLNFPVNYLKARNNPSVFSKIISK